MDCYFHSNVPSVAPCADCGKPICATCRDATGYCPSCRLAAKIDAASGTRQAMTGQVPPRGQQAWRNAWQQQAAAPQAPPSVQAQVEEAGDPLESRALVAMGFPLFPLALLALFDRKHSKRLRKNAYQAIGFNLGMALLYGGLSLLSQLPVLNISADILLLFFTPIFIVLSVYYGIKAWHNDEVHVPVVADWLEERFSKNSA